MEPFVIQRSTLPFRGEEPNFQKWLPNFEVAASIEAGCHATSTTSKGLSENFKEMSWYDLLSSIDAKNSIGFFVQFFGVIVWSSYNAVYVCMTYVWMYLCMYAWKCQNANWGNQVQLTYVHILHQKITTTYKQNMHESDIS